MDRLRLTGTSQQQNKQLHERPPLLLATDPLNEILTMQNAAEETEKSEPWPQELILQQ